jgi:hypothetical protein
MFSQRSSVEPMQTIYFRLPPEVSRARKILPGLHLGNLRKSPQTAKRISALPHARFVSALPGWKILFLLLQIGRTKPACIRGETV